MLLINKEERHAASTALTAVIIKLQLQLNAYKACALFRVHSVRIGFIFYSMKTVMQDGDIMLRQSGGKMANLQWYIWKTSEERSKVTDLDVEKKHNQDSKINFIHFGKGHGSWHYRCAAQGTPIKASSLYLIRPSIINLTLCVYPSPGSVLNCSRSTCMMESRLTQPVRQTGRQAGKQAGIDFKMSLSNVSPAWMRWAAYEKALLDIDGDKDVSRNELFLGGEVTQQCIWWATGHICRVVLLLEVCKRHCGHDYELL